LRKFAEAIVVARVRPVRQWKRRHGIRDLQSIAVPLLLNPGAGRLRAAMSILPARKNSRAAASFCIRKSEAARRDHNWNSGFESLGIIAQR